MKFAARPGTRRSTNNPPTFEEQYVLTGVADAGQAKILATGFLASTLIVNEGIVYLQDVECTEQGFANFYIRGLWASQPKATGQLGFSFDTTGGSFHITHSRQTVHMYTPSGEGTPDNKQAIGLKKRGREVEIDGTDIIIPALKMTYTFRHPAGIVNEAFASRIAAATSCVNSTVFRGIFQPGEALFLGGKGSSGTATESEVSYDFAVEKNLTGLIIDAINGIAKDGHDYLWVNWVDSVEPDGTPSSSLNQPQAKPKKVYIERLYNRIDFPTYLGWN